MKYENQILDAIETIVNSAISKAGYDKTIQATIIKCEDATIGKYKVQYQDSTFYAYSGSSEINYSEGTEVYILVPNNDMSRDKTILGTTVRLGKNYAAAPEGEDAFEVIGSNCVESSNSYELCSYKNTTEYVIYDRNKNDNNLRLNQKSIDTYIHSSTSIILAAKIKTNLPTEQQFRGNYGIIYELVFSDNASKELVTRDYVLDVNQFEGNPYKMPNYKRQVGIFDIDGVNFKYINRIYLVCYDFPNQVDGKPNDIFIKDLEICGSQPLSAIDLESSSLSFITPQGTYFDDNDLDSATRLIQAQVRVKGKNIDPKTQTLPYYWFIENNSVTSMSEDFCSYGGQGWKCLNTHNVIKRAENGAAPVVEWVPANYEFTVKKSMSDARETKYKCAVIFNNILLSREFTITNYSSNYEISIQSDGGTQFYYDIGNPSLTCLINRKEQSGNEYTYQWAEIDNNNNFYFLAETNDLNQDYNTQVSKYNQLKEDIKNEKLLAAANQDKLDEYLNNIKKYDKIMRVEGNKIHHLQVNTITNFTTYKCSVYRNGIYIGTSSIVIKNDLDKQDVYSLVINQGSQTFKYNEAGVSPVSDSLENPQTITPLSFTVYDNLGQPLEEDVIKNCKIKWIVPIEDTLLIIPSFYDGEGTISDSGNEKIFEGLLEFNYQIKDKYDVAKKNNNIQLIVDYKGMNLATKTDFTFAKEGEPGTNGTEFICKIVPNTNNKNFGYPMVINGNINYTPKQANRWFNVEFWHSGNKIFTGNSTGNTSEGKSANVKWSILKNKYTTSIYDVTSLSVTDAGVFSYNGYKGGNSPANIIKVVITYDGIEYYATLPLITATAESGYNVSLIENTGFRFATYSADGRKPQYDNSNPFELKVTKVINNIKEDISTLTKDYAVNYDWHIRGVIYDPINKKWVDSLHLTKHKGTNNSLKRNQASYKPIDDYNGECVTNALECIILDKSANEVAKIHIPIHLLLNKYGNAAINGWDGNSVSIDKDGCGVILAPQIGAGHKEADNSFTGMVMGDVKEAGKNKADTGLFGYNFGTRSIFLNAKDGSAIFGKKGPGQIILDPTAAKAMLYSSDYWKNYSDDGKPSSYNKSNKGTGGMLIDLTTPRIEWGNGNFVVDENGHLTAKGGGTIAGFNIDDDSLFTGTKNAATNVQLSSADFNRTINGVDRTGLRLALGNHFGVANDGTLYSSAGNIGGWTINGTELVSNNGNTHITCSGALNGPNWSIDASGNATFNNIKITSGSYVAGRGDLVNYGSRFRIEENGTLHASNGRFNGDITGSNITGGSIYISNSPYYFAMGKATDHPRASSINVRDVISFRTSGASADESGNEIGWVGTEHTDGIGLQTTSSNIVFVRTENAFRVQNTSKHDRFVVNIKDSTITCQSRLYLNGGLTVGGKSGKSETVVISNNLSLVFTYGVLTSVNT